MIGDKLIIKDFHRKAASGVFDIVWETLASSKERHAVTVAGESGSGKSEIAAVLAELLEARGVRTYIFQQDDYFVYPPRTNAKKRVESISHVGLSEVRLDLLDANLADFLAGKDPVVKPLVIFEEDRVTEETVSLKGCRVAVAEGTYTTLLGSAGTHVFIDRDYLDTKKARLERAREAQDDFLERILKIEHDIISKHKALAHIVINKSYEAKPC
jgi:uridine kinase